MIAQFFLNSRVLAIAPVLDGRRAEGEYCVQNLRSEFQDGTASRDAGPGAKGRAIREKIARNRAKRLSISDAMKREAGVTGHEINTEDLRGLAYLGTGRIYSPEGRNLMELYIVAHECGHIFLQNSAPGCHLPAHVKELEAESYAHQAFREHGMTMPKHLSDWGRRYVGTWIDKDRAEGGMIDPRAVAYAAGERSPYEPLRAVPATWWKHAAESAWLPRPLRRLRARVCQLAFDVLGTVAVQRVRSGLEEISAFGAFVAKQLVYGAGGSAIAINYVHASVQPLPGLVETYNLTWLGIQVAVAGALVWTDIAVAVRLAFARKPWWPARDRDTPSNRQLLMKPTMSLT